MARSSSSNANIFANPRYVNLVLPFDINAPTAFEMDTFLQMVTHSIQCKSTNCYLTAGPLSCRSIKDAVRHCHSRESVQRGCLCAMCRSFGKLYARHIGNCRLPISHCPYDICALIKRRVVHNMQREAAQAQAASNTTASDPLIVNAPVQQSNNEGTRQNSNVDAATTAERTSPSSTSTSEALLPNASEESNARDRQNPGT